MVGKQNDILALPVQPDRFPAKSTVKTVRWSVSKTGGGHDGISALPSGPPSGAGSRGFCYWTMHCITGRWYATFCGYPYQALGSFENEADAISACEAHNISRILSCFDVDNTV